MGRDWCHEGKRVAMRRREEEGGRRREEEGGGGGEEGGVGRGGCDYGSGLWTY